MAAVNERLGEAPCPVCKAKLTVRRNPAGTICVSCAGADGCDFSGFAKKGTQAAQLLTAGLAKQPPAPGPAPAPKGPAPATPGAFSLAGLSRE